MSADQIAIRGITLLSYDLSKVGFSFSDVKETDSEKGVTTYGTLETKSSLIVVRVSNHICSMRNWTERYKPVSVPNKKLARRMGNNMQTQYKKRVFFSIVFKAFDYKPNDNGTWKATCAEYVFNPMTVEENGQITKIANDAKNLRNGVAIPICGVSPSNRETRNNNIQTENRTDMKRRIHLTENQFSRLVENATRQCLTELDWKTYANAAKKNNQRMKDDMESGRSPSSWEYRVAYGPNPYDRIYDRDSRRAFEFSRAANRALSNKYSARKELSNGQRMSVEVSDNGYPYVEKGYDEYYRDSSNPNKLMRSDIRYDKDGFPYDNSEYGLDYNDIFDGQHELRGRFDAMSDERDDYDTGRYYYVKGKGWQKKR